MTRKLIVLALLVFATVFSTTAFSASLTTTPEAMPAVDTPRPLPVATSLLQTTVGVDFLTFLNAGEVTPLMFPGDNGCSLGCRMEKRQCLTSCNIHNDDCFFYCLQDYIGCITECAS